MIKDHNWQPIFTADKTQRIEVLGKKDITVKRESPYNVTWNQEFSCFTTKNGDVVVASHWRHIKE